MANQEHLDLLIQGTFAWNEWRKQHPEIRPDLREATLCGADLSEADLRRADLWKADLSGANLSKANLSKANLNSANFSRAYDGPVCQDTD